MLMLEGFKIVVKVSLPTKPEYSLWEKLAEAGVNKLSQTMKYYVVNHFWKLVEFFSEKALVNVLR